MTRVVDIDTAANSNKMLREPTEEELQEDNFNLYYKSLHLQLTEIAEDKDDSTEHVQATEMALGNGPQRSPARYGRRNRRPDQTHVCGDLSKGHGCTPAPSPTHRNRKNPGDWHIKYSWWYCGPKCGKDCCGVMPDRLRLASHYDLSTAQRNSKKLGPFVPVTKPQCRMHVPNTKASL